MAITTPSMGLKRWDQPNDIFSYVELSDNFALLDSHDHTGGKGVQIPTGGIANLAVDTTKLADNSVTNTKIPVSTLSGDRLQNATLPDTKISSPNNGVWRTLQSQAGFATSSIIANTNYGFGANGSFIASGAASSQAMFIFPWQSSYYTVANKSTKLRVVGTLITNGTAPGSNVILSLNPATSGGGGSGVVTTTLAAAVNATAKATAPGASSLLLLQGSSFDPPSNGFYALAFSLASTPTAGTALSLNVALQISHV